MTLRTLGAMEVLRPIEFTEALAWFQAHIDEEVRVVVNLYGHFFGCGLQGTLSCVETLPPDNSAIRLVLSEGQGLFLDPAELVAYLAIDGNEAQRWLEFQTNFGVIVTVELDSGSELDAADRHYGLPIREGPCPIYKARRSSLFRLAAGRRA